MKKKYDFIETKNRGDNIFTQSKKQRKQERWENILSIIVFMMAVFLVAFVVAWLT